jgi:hypothetical protein
MADPQDIQQSQGLFFHFPLPAPRNPPRDAHILQGAELRQKMVELEHKTDMTITESRQRLPLQFMDLLIPKKISPAAGSSRVPRICSKVLFPDPEGPTMLTISPLAMSTSTPFSTHRLLS